MLKRILKTMIGCVFLVTLAAHAETRSPEQVLLHHIEALKQGDFDKLMSDYAPNAVAVLPTGIFVGKQGIHKLVESIVANKDALGNLQVSRKPLGDDTLLQHFVMNPGTAQEFAGDEVFVVRQGKIVFQAMQSSAGPLPK
ncbi:MAG: nuclear transport factor 2 family protein [Steroidobacteraceae bacterium]